MPDRSLTYLEHEQRIRAAARANEIWRCAVQLYACSPQRGLKACVEEATGAYAVLLDGMLAIEPVTRP